MSPDLLLFADDVGLWTSVYNRGSKLVFQEDLTPLKSWTYDDELPFSTSKCKVVHLKYVVGYEYNLDNNPREASQVEKDLGVLVTYDLRSYPNCSTSAFKENLELVTLKSIFGYVDRTYRIIFNSFIQPYLENENIMFPHSLQKDKDTL